MSGSVDLCRENDQENDVSAKDRFHRRAPFPYRPPGLEQPRLRNQIPPEPVKRLRQERNHHSGVQAIGQSVAATLSNQKTSSEGYFDGKRQGAEGRGLIIGSPPEAASGRAQKKEYLRETKIFRKSYLQIVS